EVLLAEGSYRRHLQNIRQDLDIISPRQVYLTGTLPPSLEPEFFRKLSLDQHTAAILRTPTARDNLRYMYLETDRQTGAITILKNIGNKLTDRQLGIIYTKSRAECNEIGLVEKLPVYHAGLNAKEKKDNYKQWVDKGGFIVATTALGLGIDEQRVDLVVSMGAFDMISMCQQFGRAGRSGRPGTAILLCPRGKLDGLLKKYAQARCKRAVVSEFLDGQAVQCGFGHNACNACNTLTDMSSSRPATEGTDPDVLIPQSSLIAHPTTPGYRPTTARPMAPQTPMRPPSRMSNMYRADRGVTPRTHMSDREAVTSWTAPDEPMPLSSSPALPQLSSQTHVSETQRVPDWTTSEELAPSDHLPNSTQRSHVSDSCADSPWTPPQAHTPPPFMSAQKPGTQVTDSYSASPEAPTQGRPVSTLGSSPLVNLTLHRRAMTFGRSSPFMPDTPSNRYYRGTTQGSTAITASGGAASSTRASLYSQQEEQHALQLSQSQRLDSETVASLAKLKNFMDMLVDTEYCPCCLILDGTSDSHYMRTCDRAVTAADLMNQARTELNPRTGGLGLTPHTGCWFCGLPQSWHVRHDRYTPDKKLNQRGKCDHMLLFWDVLGVLLTDMPLMQQAVHQLGGPGGMGDGGTMLGSKQQGLREGVGYWLRARVKTLDGLETSNLVVVVAKALQLKGVTA
ncbi:hypothetical protein F4861DRAFT_548775, partial [Xylaria intraflava]